MAQTIIIDAKGLVFGRVATIVAKELLKGNEVILMNCEELVISGDKKLFVSKILQKRKMGAGSSLKGPKYIRRADRLVKRMIRGMLPWDKPKGRQAYKRLKCYNTTETLDEEQVKKAVTFDHQMPSRYTSIKQVINRLI